VEESCLKCLGISFAKLCHFSFISLEKSVKCLGIPLSEIHFLGVWGKEDSDDSILVICLVKPEYQVLMHETWYRQREVRECPYV
jgi:hypothetical protein